MALKPYKRNFGLFLTWEDGDNGGKEFQKQRNLLMKAFGNVYHFEVEMWPIPSDDPSKALNGKLAEFFGRGGSKCTQPDNTTLLLLYYGGHAIFNTGDSGDLLLVPHPNAPVAQQVSWTISMAPILHHMNFADALLILDCCYASRAYHSLEMHVISSTNSVALLAAATDDAQTPIDGERTFTKNVYDTLEELYATPISYFTVEEFYGKLSIRAKQWRQDGNGHKQSCIPVPLLCRPSKTQTSPMVISKTEFEYFREEAPLPVAKAIEKKEARLAALSTDIASELGSDTEWDTLISFREEASKPASKKPEQPTPAPRGIYNQFDPHDNMIDTGDDTTVNSGGGFWGWLASRPKPTRPYSPPPEPSSAFDVFSPDASVAFSDDVDNSDDSSRSEDYSAHTLTSTAEHHSGTTASASESDTNATSSSNGGELASDSKSESNPESFSFLSQWD